MKKIIRIVVVFISVILMFLACSPKKVLVVGTSPDFMPYQFLDEDGTMIGFDIDFMNEIGSRIGHKIEWRAMEFIDILPAVASGDIDAGISAITITAQRLQEVLFSTAYTTNVQVLVVRNEDESWNNLDKYQIEERLSGNIRIGACDNYVGLFYAEKIIGEEGTLIDYLNFSLALEALKSDLIDVIIMDRMVARKTAEIVENNIKIVDVTLTTENYGIAMNPENDLLKEKIDQAIIDIFEDGTLEKLTIYWKE
ncbi:MAG: ABC transporter substrate-binding protein [Candidatus Cloacimonetes bacterium]|nr:ABC transporter substrate-binding protein [Candidatus Cloacimonadota bacterium]